MGHLTFVSNYLSVVGNKRILQFFDSAHAPRSGVLALVDSVVVVTLYSYIVEYAFVQSVERRQAEQEIRSG